MSSRAPRDPAHALARARGPVLVTGATGFLGSVIADELARRGRPVHALARASSDRSALQAGLDVRWHAGDLLAPETLERAVLEFARDARAAPGGEDCAPAIVHCAAVISYRTADGELQRRANVEGTRALLGASARSGVRRFVHVSSVVALGPASGSQALDESAPFEGAALRCDYVDTKREAELAALDANGPELEVVVASPGAVFGTPRRPTNTSRFLASLAAHPTLGLFAPPGSLSVVGVEDVARGIVLALERGTGGRRYLLCESNVALVDLYRMVFECLGRGRVLGAVPRPLWRAVCAGAGALDRVKALDFATPQGLRLLGASFLTRADRARSELGWEPEPFDAVLARALAPLQGARPRTRGR